MDVSTEGSGTGDTRRRLGLVAGPLAALAVYAVLPDTWAGPGGELRELGHAGRATAAVATWMAVWWMTEAIALYATALLPIALFPVLGVASIREAAAPYAHELIYLFLGGFVLALSMQRWKLDRRISLLALRLAGSRPDHIVATFMGVTAVLSMWVSNTATAVMMLPIALGVVELLDAQAPDDEPGGGFPVCLLLGIAYAASIGGVGTLIGTPPNLFLASYASSNLGVEIGFLQWMTFGLPLVVLLLPLAWLLLTRVLFRLEEGAIEGGRAHVDAQLRALGPVGRGEWATFAVFGFAATAWLTRPWLTRLEFGGVRPLEGLTDPGIAVLAALVLFVIPVGRQPRTFAMDWETARLLPWGLLVLFGGGLSLAAAIRANHVGEYLGSGVAALAGMPVWALVLGVVALLIFLTEITSNTATTATLLPILAALAPGLDVDPLRLVVPAAVAASCAFMLPVATPPNAVVFGSGRVAIPQMARAGFLLNLVGIVLITALAYALVLPLLGAGAGGAPAH